MFSRKNCGRCGASLKPKYSFCPYCGNPLGSKEEDFGMLGKDDSFERINEMPRQAGFGMIFNSLIRNLEKQFNDQNRKDSKPEERKGNINITISTFAGNPPMINMGQNLTPNLNPKKKKAKTFSSDFSPDKMKKFSTLPREEPKTSIRRLANKLLYEVELPGVKSIRDISILNLDKGIELKALSDKKAYSKSIPINMPISRYKLLNGKLTIEMNAL
ncbi:MAG: zinc ribbon domain-containing protein [Candidatus Pacearchaeota archaeon]|nr:zinc ribbon domain-containing protein [Candidatus Pacearchaeota archaeon]MDE1848745.1 zinc ribbon domain-containing protein [Nanoarchaeota archaeon]